VLFSEPTFLFVFLPFILAAAAFGSVHTRNTTLAAGSILFYAWDYLDYAGVLCASIGMNYLIGLAVDRRRPPTLRKFAVTLGLLLNLGLLAGYKYGGFVVANLNPLRAMVGAEPWEITPPVMPLGISFFTFQAMSYVLDVHRGNVSAQRNPIDLALYIALFPQLIAGPIVRYTEIVGQIARRTVSHRGFNLGVRRFVVGLAKKLLVADILATPATVAFEMSPDDLTTPIAWLGLTCFSLQIYFDFSGYSDMAIGLGRMFGFRIPENFRLPYTAHSVTEFWRRWHMTLARWFRDYLYIPLGGNRRSPARTYLNLFLVFLLCGLWHGASWNFVFWGFLHGAFLTGERIGWARALGRLPSALARIYTLGAVMLGWVFFQCESLEQAFGYLSILAGQELGGRTVYAAGDLATNSVLLALTAGLLGAGGGWHRARATLAAWRRRAGAGASRRTRRFFLCAARDGATLLLFVVCCLRLAASTYTPFLYFRF